MSSGPSDLKKVFQPLDDFEAMGALAFAITNQVEMIGLTDSKKSVICIPKTEGATDSTFFATTKGLSTVSKKTDYILISFVIEEKKYLFKAQLLPAGKGEVRLDVISKIYSLQRRRGERIKVSESYFNLIKLTHRNGRPIKGFAVLYDISSNGVSIVLKSGFSEFAVGDLVRASISVKKRPSDEFEFMVKHTKKLKKGDVVAQMIGGVFHPEGQIQMQRRMNSLLLDVCRDSMAKLEKQTG
ncbi:MAG: hypothetical protein RJB66_1647 [Pseudomonadota bacterium]|jgi:c-di-GMP-binding flagellar brake protein YcgR